MTAGLILQAAITVAVKPAVIDRRYSASLPGKAFFRNLLVLETSQQRSFCNRNVKTHLRVFLSVYVYDYVVLMVSERYTTVSMVKTIETLSGASGRGTPFLTPERLQSFPAARVVLLD